MAKRTAAERQAAWEVRQREREARWRAHVDGWRSGGTTQAAYCRQHGLTPAEFSWWKHELARRARRCADKQGGPGGEVVGGFVPLRLTAERTGSVCEVELRNGRRLRLADGLDPRWVAELAAALEDARAC
jgi:hypothetical protein